MKNRLTVFVFTLLTLVFLQKGFVYAATLTLTKIGALGTAGKSYSEWWYSGTRPLLEGKAESSKEVTIKVDGKEGSTQANTEGDWAYRLLYDKGDYNVVITSGSETISFKLHLGSGLPSSTTAETTQTTGAAVPTTGMEQTVALFLGMGISLLALYFYFYESNRKHKAFEKDIVSEN